MHTVCVDYGASFESSQTLSSHGRQSIQLGLRETELDPTTKIKTGLRSLKLLHPAGSVRSRVEYYCQLVDTVHGRDTYNFLTFRYSDAAISLSSKFRDQLGNGDHNSGLSAKGPQADGSMRTVINLVLE
jgi:hypothetical protein